APDHRRRAPARCAVAAPLATPADETNTIRAPGVPAIAPGSPSAARAPARARAPCSDVARSRFALPAAAALLYETSPRSWESPDGSSGVTGSVGESPGSWPPLSALGRERLRAHIRSTG